MAFKSILDLYPSPYKGLVRPSFFVDLNLDQVLSKVCVDLSTKEKSNFYYFPKDKECEEYRRAVYKDIKRPGMQQLLMVFLQYMKKREQAMENFEAVHDPLQKKVWFLSQVHSYFQAVESLICIKEQFDSLSDGFSSLIDYVENLLKDSKVSDLHSKINELYDYLKSCRILITYDKDRIVLSEATLKGSYEEKLDKLFPDHASGIRAPFMDDMDLCELEVELIKIYKKKNPEFFAKLENLIGNFPEYADPVILQFCNEVVFYLSFYKFQMRMTEIGFSFVTPISSSDHTLNASGLYDLALACSNYDANKEVVDNEAMLTTDEKFFVVTGPNQGGKTTFARSLGQMVYFAKMGLDVPAISAKLPFYSNLLTHFNVEESVETGKGKLKEELTRLAPMMHAHNDNSFVVINELFTTAANYDACIMGKKVLEYFIDQGCHGIYVTHLKDLSNCHPKIVSMRASLNDQNQQTFKVVRGEAEDLAYAGNQINKYRLHYDQIKDRLQQGNTKKKEQ